MKLQPGNHVLYIPNHANGDRNHPDCEEGFITSIKKLWGRKEFAWCRYWSRIDPTRLRTTSCSEMTPMQNLVKLEDGPAWLPFQCMNCNGSGFVSHYTYDGDDFVGAKDCPVCHGNGRLVVYRHDHLAYWPGGPFAGKLDGKYASELIEYETTKRTVKALAAPPA